MKPRSSSHGQTLIGILVVGVITAIIGVSTAKMISGLYRAERGIATNLDKSQLITNIKLLLNDQNNCSHSNLMGMNVSALLNPTPTPIPIVLNAGPSVVFAAGTTFHSRRISHLRMNRLNPTGVLNEYLANIRMRADVIGQAMSTRGPIYDFLVPVSLNSLGEIINCGPPPPTATCTFDVSPPITPVGGGNITVAITSSTGPPVLSPQIRLYTEGSGSWGGWFDYTGPVLITETTSFEAKISATNDCGPYQTVTVPTAPTPPGPPPVVPGMYTQVAVLSNAGYAGLGQGCSALALPPGVNPGQQPPNPNGDNRAHYAGEIHCNSGDLAVGGGADCQQSGGGTLMTSRPVPGDLTGWYVDCCAYDRGVGAVINGFVQCLKVK